MKLKSLLKESNAWDRKFGEPLPTLEDTARAYRLRKEGELPPALKKAIAKKKSEEEVSEAFKMTNDANIRLLHREVNGLLDKDIIPVSLGVKYIREILNMEKIGDPGKKLKQAFDKLYKELQNIEKQLPRF
jgi:hypothetical protein